MKAPIMGQAEFLATFAKNKLQELQKVFAALQQMKNPHVAYYLLKHAAGVCKVLYLMRTTPKHMLTILLQGFDVEVKQAFEKMVGRELTAEAWEQAKLPLRLAGCGLRGAEDGADIAYVSSRAFTMEACKELDTAFVAEGSADRDVLLGLGTAMGRINAILPPEKSLGDTVATLTKNWEYLGHKVEGAKVDEMMQQAGEWDKARLNGLKAKHAAAWLEGVPSQALGTRMSGEEFRSRMGRRLGIEMCEEKPCPLCFQTLDRFGAHAEGCMGGGDAVARHNENRDTIHRQAKAAGARPELEKARLLAGVGRVADLQGRRPADTLLHNPGGIHTARGRPMARIALDVGFVNPQATGHLRHAAAESLGAATLYTKQKRDKNNTDDLCMAVGVDYQPIVWETTGGIAEEGRETIKSLNRLVAVNANTPLAEVARRFWQRTSVDLQKASHRALAKRVAWEVGEPETRSGRYLRTGD